MSSNIAHRGTPTTNAGTGAVNVTIPSGTTTGDLLVLACESNGGEAVTTPSGWTLIANPDSGAGGTRLTVFYKVAGASEATVTVADPGDHLQCVMFSFTGVDGTGLIRASATGTAASSTAMTFPVVAGANVNPGDFVLHLGSVSTDTGTAQLSSFASSEMDFTLGKKTSYQNSNYTSSVNTTNGNGGGIVWVSGYSANGNSTDGSAVLLTASVQAMMTLVFVPNATTSDQLQVTRVGLGAVISGADDAVVVTRIGIGFVVDTSPPPPPPPPSRRRNFMSFIP